MKMNNEFDGLSQQRIKTKNEVNNKISCKRLSPPSSGPKPNVNATQCANGNGIGIGVGVGVGG